MDLGVTQSNDKSERIRTLKMRLFPTETQKTNLKLMFEQFRWYYNETVSLVRKSVGEEKSRKQLSYITIRDKIVSKYHYTEDYCKHGDIVFVDTVFDDDNNKIPVPSWWEGKMHSRIPRGAIKQFSSSWNSAVTNTKGKPFEMKTKNKKDDTENVYFEDSSFPSELRNIDSKYWFSDKSRKRKHISFADIWRSTKHRGIEIIHEKPTGRYFLHYPIDRTWYPSDDRRNENQITSSESNRIISLDPGVRKFLVGYDPLGKSVIVGNRARNHLLSLLKKEDKGKTFEGREHIKNMVRELHWKTIRYLVSNYDTIMFSDFRVSNMVKRDNLNDDTKRLLLAFSFHAFKLRLQYKCDMHGKKLIIVDESYTSKTCGKCGFLNDVGSDEEYHCVKCGLVGDRDVLASRNIMLKNISLKENTGTLPEPDNRFNLS